MNRLILVLSMVAIVAATTVSTTDKEVEKSKTESTVGWKVGDKVVL